MKIHPHALPPAQARKELKQVSIFGLIASVVGLVIFWFLGIVGIALGIRALLLSYNKHLADKKELLGYRAMGVGAIIVGIFDLLGGIALNG